MRKKQEENTVMGKTSSAVKDKWNARAYDNVTIRFPKGRKADVVAYAESRGESVNGLVARLLMSEMGLSEDDWKREPADVAE